jgi:hypothetical protein
MTSVSITSKKHGTARIKIAPHYGYTAMLLGGAALVYALGWAVVSVIGVSNGRGVTTANPYSTVDVKPHVEPVVQASLEPPARVASKSDRETPVQAPVVASDVPRIPPKIELSTIVPVTDVGASEKEKVIKKSRPVKMAGRDYGTVTIITPYQGDAAPDVHGLSSFFDDGVRYNVSIQRCSKKLRSMYEQCYYPKDKPRPPVYNW